MKEWKNYIMPVEKKIDKDRFKEYKADNDRKFEAVFRMIGELRR